MSTVSPSGYSDDTPEAAVWQTWHTYGGAQYTSLQAVPCFVISNGYLITATGNPLYEDTPAIAAEIERRGRDVYLDHGYGVGHGSVSVAGCDHSEVVPEVTS